MSKGTFSHFEAYLLIPSFQNSFSVSAFFGYPFRHFLLPLHHMKTSFYSKYSDAQVCHKTNMKSQKLFPLVKTARRQSSVSSGIYNGRTLKHRTLGDSETPPMTAMKF